MIKHSIQMMKEQKIESFKKNKENIIDNDILSELKKHFDVQNQEELKQNINKHLETISVSDNFKKYLQNFIINILEKI